jgi:hypothetical protein
MLDERVMLREDGVAVRVSREKVGTAQEYRRREPRKPDG